MAKTRLHTIRNEKPASVRAPRRVIHRAARRLGLEGKLLVAFGVLLNLAVWTSLLMSLQFSKNLMDDLLASAAPNGGELVRIADARFIELRTTGAIAALGMLGVGLPLVWVSVRRVFLPVRELVNATDRVAAGDANAQVAIHRSDDIGDLARSFNLMVCRVRDHQIALRRANEQLELKVARRTAELEEANRRLVREIADKDDFVRTVSHDLGAPLRNIAGMTAMLLMKHRSQFDSETLHRLERIERNVRVETDLIGELLELSRIKSRRARVEPVDLEQIVRELREVLEDDLRTREITLKLATGLPTVYGERLRFRQLLLNLLDNAVKYMGDGDVRTITLGCERVGDGAEFYVSDTGIGMDEHDCERVFGVFRRGRSPAVQSVPGRGVGLACVKSIVETCGGRIWVTSRPGEGSTFRFTMDEAHLNPPPKVIAMPRIGHATEPLAGAA